MSDGPECPQCMSRNTRPVAYDNSEPATGYRDAGVVQACADCGERF